MRCLRPALLLFLLLLSACGDDTPVENPPPPPEGPRMHNIAGTGTGGVGEIGQLPLDTDLQWPQDITFAPDSTLVVVDWGNHRIIGIDPSTGLFKQYAGTLDGSQGEPCLPLPSPCDVGGLDTPFNHPTDIHVDPDGKMVLSAWHNAGVFLLDPSLDTMNRIAGTGRAGYEGEGAQANATRVSFPAAAIRDLQGRLVFTDQINQIVRRIDENGVISIFAGTQPVWDGTRYIPQPGFTGDEGPATSAKLSFHVPSTCGKLAIDAGGNIYIADSQNHAIRMVDTAGMIHRFAGVHPASAGFSGDGGPATSARLNMPRDVTCDAVGNVFIADTENHVIRMVDPSGVISTVAGKPGVTGDGSENGNVATQTPLSRPFGIAIDPRGNLWIADTDHHRIRVVYFED